MRNVSRILPGVYSSTATNYTRIPILRYRPTGVLFGLIYFLNLIFFPRITDKKNLNKIFSCKKTKSQTVITSLTVPDGVVTDRKDICNSLNKYFSSVCDKLVQVLEKCDPRDFVRYCPPTNSASMFCTPTDPFEIHKVLMSFKSNKSPGADDFSPKILKEISIDTSRPLAHIF